MFLIGFGIKWVCSHLANLVADASCAFLLLAQCSRRYDKNGVYGIMRYFIRSCHPHAAIISIKILGAIISLFRLSRFRNCAGMRQELNGCSPSSIGQIGYILPGTAIALSYSNPLALTLGGPLSVVPLITDCLRVSCF